MNKITIWARSLCLTACLLLNWPTYAFTASYASLPIHGNPKSVDNLIPTISSGGTTVFCSGGSLLLTSSVADSYEWYKDNVLIVGATSQTYNVTENGVYKVSVSYGEGSTGTSAGLLVRQGNTWTGSAADGDWNNPANWSCGVLPLTSDHVVINDATGDSPIIGNASLTSVKSLTLTTDAQLTVQSGSTLEVENAINVNATANLTLEDEASLVQINDVNNTGNITAEKNSAPVKRYDFTYWSSPVSGQTLYNLSPGTLADKYYSFSPTIGNWVTHLNGAQVMEEGKGYIVRAPQSFDPSTPATYEGAFVGTPNNGLVLVPIVIGNSDMNLIGNPYPSAIDMDAFLMHPGNAAITDGTVYLWTHNSPPASIPGGGTYNYTSNDYAAYNLMGGTATSTAGNNEVPTGKLASGQSFFIKGLGNGQATFENSMRVAFDNDQFFRHQAQSTEKHRLWLNLSNSEGAFKQTLLGYADGATNGVDRGYDGIDFNGNSFVNLYTLSADQRFNIQGRALPFEQDAAVPMGYSTTMAGTFAISIDHFDGLFGEQSVYLYDYATETTHDLKASAYEFTSAIGTFNNRFELRFNNSTLSTATFTADHIMMAAHDNQLEISSALEMESVTVSDISGRTIYRKDNMGVKSTSITDGNFGNTVVLLVNIKLGNGNTFVKKIIMN